MFKLNTSNKGRLLVAFFIFTLFLLSTSAAYAGTGLEDALEALNLPDSISVHGNTVYARFDNNKIVYGNPKDVTGETPAQQYKDGQYRYLGYTYTGEAFTNKNFPNDATETTWEERNWISEPWDAHINLCGSNNRDIPDNTWDTILSQVPSIIADPTYLKVLSQPLVAWINDDLVATAGSVRAWHKKANGAIWYETFNIDPTLSIDMNTQLDIQAVSIDSGVPDGTKAIPGQKYTGKATYKVLKMEKPGEYHVPINIYNQPGSQGTYYQTKINELPLTTFTTFQAYDWLVKNEGDTITVTFKWTCPSTSKTKLVAVANINYPGSWDSVDPAEACLRNLIAETDLNNNKAWTEVPTDAVNLIALRIHPGVEGEADPGGEYIAAVDFNNDSDKYLTDVPVGGFNREYRAVLKDAADNEVQYADFAPGETKTLFFTYHASDAGTTTISGVIDTPPLDDLVKESNEQDNKVSVDVTVRETNPVYGDPRLNLQAYSKAGEDVYGNWHDSKARQAFTAKWTDDVKATLTVPRPTPPKGKLDWWKISWAKITYPKKNPDFQYGDPLPSIGTVTKSMNVPGSGTESEKKATITFEEDWGMDGAGIYNMIRDEVMAEYQKNYPISVSFEVTYQYTYTVCHGFTCSQVTKTASYTDTATANLKVDGTGVGSYAQ